MAEAGGRAVTTTRAVAEPLLKKERAKKAVKLWKHWLNIKILKILKCWLRFVRRGGSGRVPQGIGCGGRQVVGVLEPRAEQRNEAVG